MGLNVDNSLLALASVILGCKTDWLPLEYLGQPLSNKRVAAADWKPLINRV